MRTMKLWRITFALLAAFSLASCDKNHSVPVPMCVLE